MLRKFRLIGALAIASLLFTQCQKEVGYVGTPDPGTGTVTPEPITATLQGNVYDETGAPAAGVTVKVGGATATTNNTGYFRIRNAALDQSSAMVSAEKSGYFKSFRTFHATPGTNQVVIKLVKKVLAGTINAATGGEVSLSNGSKVALQPNGIVVASSSNAYTGTVNVYAAYIDPSAQDIDQVVPGSFMANDKNNNRVTLVSYGMLAVELESASGDKLQLKSGTPATLTTAIPASLQATAPATIALWSVNESNGFWKEEGTATKNGSVYVGEVSHFSFWNCDIGIPAVTVKMTVKNAAGQPIVHALVRIRRTNVTQGQSYGYTDSLGHVSGLVPKNESLVLDVLDNCYGSVYTQNIGPFTQTTNLGVITVSATAPGLVTVKGKLLNCSGAAVTSGYVIIYQGNTVRYATPDANGNFEKTFVSCPTANGNYEIIGLDSATQQQSTAVNGTLTLPVTNVGNISACGVSTNQYINYTLDGVNYSFTGAVADSLTGWTSGNASGTTSLSTNISGFNMNSNNSFGFSFISPTATAGSYALSTLRVQNYQQGNTLVTPFHVTMTTFPTAVGLYYEGSLTGQFRDAQNVLHNVSSTFRVRRSF